MLKHHLLRETQDANLLVDVADVGGVELDHGVIGGKLVTDRGQLLAARLLGRKVLFELGGAGQDVTAGLVRMENIVFVFVCVFLIDPCFIDSWLQSPSSLECYKVTFQINIYFLITPAAINRRTRKLDLSLSLTHVQQRIA